MKPREASLSHETLIRVLDYDTATGVFLWKVVNSNRAKVGSQPGFKAPAGHRVIELYGVRYWAHRLAWFYVYKSWPQEEIDHINNMPDDNRIENLREASHQQNNCNKKSRNKTGFKGVTKHKFYPDKYMSQIRSGGKTIYLGIFDTIEAAHDAYVSASQIYHGAYGRST